MAFSGIYQIQSNIKPERIYVGSAVNIDRRWKRHIYNLKNKIHDNIKLQRHYDKYGIDDLVFSVLEKLDSPTKEYIVGREQFYMDLVNPFFNICRIAYSTLGVVHSEESKRKCRESNLGQKRSPELCKFFSDTRKGKKRSPEIALKCALSHVGLKRTASTKYKQSIWQRSIAPEIILLIKEDIKNKKILGLTYKQIALKYNVGVNIITRISYGQSYLDYSEYANAV